VSESRGQIHSPELCPVSILSVTRYRPSFVAKVSKETGL
jgi:hypothetical protein